MTAIANPPSLPINRPFWGPNNSGHQLPASNSQSDDFSRAFAPSRGKPNIQRTNSSSSISSTSSTSSVSTVLSTPQSNSSSVSSNGDMNASTWSAPKKRPPQKAPWPPYQNGGGSGSAVNGSGGPGAASNGGPVGGLVAAGNSQPDFPRPAPNNRKPSAVNGNTNGGGPVSVSGGHPAPSPPPQVMAASNRAPITGASNGNGNETAEGQPEDTPIALYLNSINGTFARKTIIVPFYPDTLRIGRQTNQRSLPTQANGFFDSKVLSRQHAEIWAVRSSGKVFIRDVKSSNGTFVNSNRLSQENRESEPHELNTGDHLELGIDIVHDDQKTVVHHKVAAKVEHAGFISPTTTPEMYVDFEQPSSGQNTPQGQGPPQGRGRAGSNTSVGPNGRMPPAAAGGMLPVQQNVIGPSRQVWMAQITTDQIVKKLQQEMRSSRLQAKDLERTGTFVGALLTKNDVKDMETSENNEAAKPHVNGGSVFGSLQGPGKRFSDPPAPPPQQPLPEKPDVSRSGEFPLLKRAVTQKPTGQTDNQGQAQVAQLSEDLKNAKKELDSQSARMRDLEAMLNKERSAREVAEELARRLEQTATKAGETKANDRELEDAFTPPPDRSTKAGVSPDDKTDAASSLQARLDTMLADMMSLKQELEDHKGRTRKAEEERDGTRKTLSEMVLHMRQEQAARKAAEEEAQSLRKMKPPTSSPTANGALVKSLANDPTTGVRSPEGDASRPLTSPPSPSRSSTVTPTKASGQLVQKYVMAQALPYASMMSVMVLGMGIMAYLNGWQTEPRVR